jgi:hypothetical protein
MVTVGGADGGLGAGIARPVGQPGAVAGRGRRAALVLSPSSGAAGAERRKGRGTLTSGPARHREGARLLFGGARRVLANGPLLGRLGLGFRNFLFFLFYFKI